VVDAVVGEGDVDTRIVAPQPVLVVFVDLVAIGYQTAHTRAVQSSGITRIEVLDVVVVDFVVDRLKIGTVSAVDAGPSAVVNVAVHYS
jgi:hypothetical protein